MSSISIPSEVRNNWKILLIAMIGTGCGLLSITFYTQGLFFGPVSREFGWSRAEFFTSYTVLMLLGVVTGPLVGKLIARYGIRTIGLAGLAGHGIGYLLLAINPGSLALWYVSYALLSILAAGSLPITWTALISRHFQSRLGLAIGITMSGTGVAAALAPLYVQFGLSAFGWRMTYATLGLIAWALATVTVLALYRNERQEGSNAPRQAGDQEGMTPAAAYRDYRFWFLCTAVFLLSLAVGGLVPNFVPLLTEKGIAPDDAGPVMSLLGIAVIAGRLTAGAIMDRLWAPAVSTIYFAGTIVGILMIWTFASLPIALAAIAAILAGLALGAELDIIAYLTRRYFGSRHYSEIFGGVYVAFAVGVGLAAPIWGALHDLSGSYTPHLIGSILVIAAAHAMILALGRYPASFAGHMDSARPLLTAQSNSTN
ncbi:MFS transporter [Brucella sp. IR073]|uniref:MFS transporter n=1 Tax=unclassified Brucella TaxID=2632610 RepID=UPI003B98059B